MTNLSLYQMSTDYEAAFLALADLDLPEEAIADTLEALEGELSLKAANVAAFVLNLEAEAEKIKAVEAKIAIRRKVFENKAARIRNYLRENMERAGIKKIEALDGSFTATLTKPRASLIIDDEQVIPGEFGETQTVIVLDKARIKAALESGQAVDGAHLEYKPGLRIA